MRNDVIAAILNLRLHVYLLKNNPAKFHPDPIWNDEALGFFEDDRPNKNNNNKISRDKRSVKWCRGDGKNRGDKGHRESQNFLGVAKFQSALSTNNPRYVSESILGLRTTTAPYMQCTLYAVAHHLSVMQVDQSKTFEVRIMQLSAQSSPIPLVFLRYKFNPAPSSTDGRG